MITPTKAMLRFLPCLILLGHINVSKAASYKDDDITIRPVETVRSHCETCGGTGEVSCGKEHCTRGSTLWGLHMHHCTRPCTSCVQRQRQERIEGVTGEIKCAACLNDTFEKEGCAVLSCGHYLCKDCMTRYIMSEVTSMDCDPIICKVQAEMKCDREISDEDVGSILGTSTSNYAKYLEMKEKIRELKNAHCETCDDTGFEPCGKEHCDKGSNFMGFHVHNCTRPCTSRICSKSNADNSVPVGLEHTKKCPGCEIRIEKDEGCENITCLICNAKFCWECLGFVSDSYEGCRSSICNPDYEPSPNRTSIDGIEMVNFNEDFRRRLTDSEGHSGSSPAFNKVRQELERNP